MISLSQVASYLKEQDNFHIYLHAYPDGDTIGSGFALCYALRSLGKKANVLCVHPIPSSYFFITDSYKDMDFEPQTLVTTDVASLTLLGQLGEELEGKIDLAIDHHGTNGQFAKQTYVDASAASNAQIILELLDELGVELNGYLADCIYTGVSTDTGCFKHTNTDAACHLVAARLMEAGAQVDLINQYMFDTKSRSRIAIEKSILDSLEFFCDGAVAFITVTKKMREDAGIADGELEGITSIPRSVEGVQIGCTLRETDSGTYKVSIRSRSGLNAAEICAKFGGGGHPCAAGCSFTCSLDEVKTALLTECEKTLEDAQ